MFHFAEEELAWRSVAMGDACEWVWFFRLICVGILDEWIVVWDFIFGFSAVLRLSSPGGRLVVDGSLLCLHERIRLLRILKGEV